MDNHDLLVRQLFVTNISASIAGLPSFEILTLPGFHRPEDFRQAVSEVTAGLKKGRRERIAISSIDKRDVVLMLERVLRSSIDARGIVRSSKRPTVALLERRHGTQVIPEYSALLANTSIPVMRSPLKGASIKTLASVAGGIGTLVNMKDLTGHQISLYFCLLGGTVMILALAEVISEALKEELSYFFWKRRKVRTSRSGGGTITKSKAKKAAPTGATRSGTPKTGRAKPPAAKKAKARTTAAKRSPPSAPAAATQTPPLPPAKRSASSAPPRLRT
jgi:hypothetical protein